MQVYENALIDQSMMLQSDGSLYIGNISEDSIDGQGLILYPDGSYYQGQFIESVPCNIGLYKMKNTCLRVEWDQGQLSDISTTDNMDFIYELIPFNKQGKYGNQLMLMKNASNQSVHKSIRPRNNTFTYGIYKHGSFNGFAVVQYPNGNIYYGNMQHGKSNGIGIIYDVNNNSWKKGTFKQGKLSNIQKQGHNLVPRDQINIIFQQIHPIRINHNMIQLSALQQLILEHLMFNNINASNSPIVSQISTKYTINDSNKPIQFVQTQATLMAQQGYEAVTHEHTLIISPEEYQTDDDLKGYQQQQIEQQQENIQIDDNLNIEQTTMARTRLSEQYRKTVSKLENSSQPQLTIPIRQSLYQQSPIRHSVGKIVYTRRSMTPVLTTIRRLYSIIRL